MCAGDHYRGGRRRRASWASRASNSGDAVVLDVVHYVGDLMSVDHVAGTGGDHGVRVRPFAGQRARPAAGRGQRGRRPESAEPQHGQPGRHGHDDYGHGQRDAVHQVRVQQVHAVRERLVVTRRAVLHAVAPQRLVDARVQLRAPAVTVRAVRPYPENPIEMRPLPGGRSRRKRRTNVVARYSPTRRDVILLLVFFNNIILFDSCYRNLFIYS